MFFSSLCFTQTTLKTFLSTHIKKIHGNVLFPTERKKIPQPSQSLWKNITTTQLTTVRRETCFVSHWKKDFFFLFLSGFFFLFGTKWKKNHSVSLKEKNLVKSFFFSLFYFISNKKHFFFLSVKERRKKSCFFHTVTHQENWRVKHLFHCFRDGKTLLVFTSVKPSEEMSPQKEKNNKSCEFFFLTWKRLHLVS